MQSLIKYLMLLGSTGWTHQLYIIVLIYLWERFGKQIRKTTVTAFKDSNAASIP